MSGLFNDDTLSLYLKLKEAMKQYVKDAMPGGLLNREVPNYPQQLADHAKAQQDTLRNAWGDPNAMADATLGMLQSGLGSFAPMGITVWHGSPHKFPPTPKNPLGEFDLSKIGTGEGAQAYGHGVYVAEAQDVGKEYARKLANVDSSGYANAQLNAQNLVQRLNGDKEWAKEVVKDQLANVEKSDPNFQRLTKTLAVLEGKAQQQLESEGNLYKVDLPDEYLPRMLDWDKPLSEQSHVMDLINKQESARTQSVLEKRLQTLANVGENSPNAATIKKQIAILQDELANPMESGIGSMTGGDYYNYLWRRNTPPQEQAEMFRKAGIPGIRYLDGGSRGAGSGTNNYVIFDPNILKILERQ